MMQYIVGFLLGSLSKKIFDWYKNIDKKLLKWLIPFFIIVAALIAAHQNILFLSNHNSLIKTWGVPILQATIGGALGIIFSYWYIVKSENKREKNTKKEKCTTSLLNTQMMLSYQMEIIKGIQDMMLEISNCKLQGETLSKVLCNINSNDVPAIYNLLSQMIPTEGEFYKNNLNTALHAIILLPVSTALIQLPSEIFESSLLGLSESEFNASSLAKFHQGIARCNKKYLKLASVAEHYEQNRKKSIHQLLTNPLADKHGILIGTLSGAFNTASAVLEQIKTYLVLANDVYRKTEIYINLLGISKPIDSQKDANENLIFTLE